MSYILDALKKAEQGRNSGKAPALFSVQIAETEVIRKPLWPWVVAAALIFNGAAFLFWLQKNKSGDQTMGVSGVAPSVSVPASQLQQSQPALPVTPMAEVATRHSLPRVDTPEPATMPIKAPTLQQEDKDVTAGGLARKTEPKRSPARKAASVEVPSRVGSGPPERILPLTELPSAIQQEIPKLVVAMHMYSDRPSNRLASINDKPMREGDELSPGLKLVEIMPDGLIFSFKGYRFKKGVN